MPRLRGRWLIPVLAAILVVPVAVAAAQPDDGGRPFPGTRTEYLGFDRHDFEADGQAFTVVSLPARSAAVAADVTHARGFLLALLALFALLALSLLPLRRPIDLVHRAGAQ